MPLSNDNLLKRVQPWLEPVSAAAPTGANARYNPDYEKMLGEVAKLEAPSGGAVDWVAVGKLGGGLLQKKSKDLLAAAYTGYAFFGAKRSLGGLLDGTVLLAELLDRHWDGLFPEVSRAKARANALGWFLQRATIGIGSVSVSASDRDVVEALLPAAQRLAELARAKFAGGGPAFGPILEALERLKLQLPPEAPPAPPPPPPPEPGAPAAAPPGAGPGGGPPAAAPATGAAMAATPPPPAAGGDAEAYLGTVGDALTTTAGNLRRASLADPTAYRVLRTGLWLSLFQLPRRGPTGGRPFRRSGPPSARSWRRWPATPSGRS